ncbi:MAG: hypothetical protein KAT68_11755 [Bacteroidales bacterium]|nr:hypothetical protein [Bacteroidales bacterium]
MSNQLFSNSLKTYIKPRFVEYALAISQNTITGTEHVITSWTKTQDKEVGSFVTEDNGIFTITKNGYYGINLITPWVPNATGLRYSFIQYTHVSGIIQNFGYQTTLSVGASLATVCSGSMLIRGEVGDTFILKTFQNSGGTLNIVGGSVQLRTKIGISLYN